MKSLITFAKVLLPNKITFTDFWWIIFWGDGAVRMGYTIQFRNRNRNVRGVCSEFILMLHSIKEVWRPLVLRSAWVRCSWPFFM